MPNHTRSVQILPVDGIAESESQPLKVRVEAVIRRAILSGNFAASTRIPASRVLARDLDVSRHTVETAFDQLVAEGFLVRRRGSGTFVADEVPARERPVRRPSGSGRGTSPTPALSERGRIITSYPGHRQPIIGKSFTACIPALDLFPRQTWNRMVAKELSRAGTDNWVYGASNGLPELRQAIAAHVAGSRAVACAPDQVIVTSSVQQAIDLIARVLLDPGDVAWVEDPGYRLASVILEAAGARLCPVPVDEDGLDVDAALALEPTARLAYVTPSHQFPTGGLMSIARRKALIDWATKHRAWIIEDDYDGDLRYVGRPLAALHALDVSGRVLYVGTFNKMMFSSLRLAYLVSPPPLVDAFLAAKHMMDGHVPGHTQAAMARFIDDGHLATHLRRLVGAYDERRQTLLASLDTLSDELHAGPSDAGLHLTTYFRHARDDGQIATACGASNVDVLPLSRYYLGTPRSGLVLGFACSRPAHTEAAMRILARVIREQRTRRKVVR